MIKAGRILSWIVLIAASGNIDANPKTGIETKVDQRFGKSHTTLVHWIEWNSHFREAGLEVGDRIVGISGSPLPTYAGDRTLQFGSNSSGESSYWYDGGNAAGDIVSLDVERGTRSFSVEAPLIDQGALIRGPDRRYHFGDDGPPERDEELGNLRYWYDQFRTQFEHWLYPYEWSEFDRRVGSYPRGSTLTNMQASIEMVALLEAKYPGRFTEFTRDIVDRAQVAIAGESRELTEAQLDWQRLGEKRAEQIAAAADAAWEAVQSELGDEIVENAFPAPDPSEEPIDEFVGRLVLMPPTTQRDLVFEAGEVVVGEKDGRVYTSSKSFFRHQQRGQRGFYFTPRHTLRMWGAYGAVGTYGQHVMPLESRDMTATVLGRIRPDPVLVSDSSYGTTQFGMELEPIAMLIASSRMESVRFFVDVREIDSIGEAPPFAGEDSLLKYELGPHDQSTSPADVLKRFVDAVKYGDYEAWREMFADWEVRWTRFNQSGEIVSELREAWLDLYKIENSWTNSQQAMRDEEHVRRQNIAPSLIYDVEVVSETPVFTIYEGTTQFRGLDAIDIEPTKIEETTIFVRYIGRFGDEYRTFSARATVGYNSYWRLQRRDGGPWMIAEIDAL